MKTSSLNLLPSTLGLTTRNITGVYLHRASHEKHTALSRITYWDINYTTRVHSYEL